ncbi:hypothetical protein [Parvibaculum sp.]|uniref:hypothetical protein n=1 Tax=Parvibaculum sp. TaxID=2024848 RepID=UPI001D7EF8DD|nr:hypothetical protein [Parvibaculum sp.]MBX3490865.1 hypothetical protein [Parvibaculum sp.]
MKTGRNIVDLAKELQRQAESKKDIVAPTSLLAMTPDASLSIRMSSETSLGEVVPVGQTAHRQIGTKLSIPAAYYDRMLQNAPELLASNVNHWFHDKPKPHLVRMLDGHVRAFLSDRYQRIDNYEVAEAALNRLDAAAGIERGQAA